MRPLVGSHRRLGAFIGWWGGLEGWPVRRRTGGGEWFQGGRGGAGWPRAAGAGGSAGGGWRLKGWSLMINWRPFISYPTVGKSNDQR